MEYRGDPSREECPRCSGPELYLSLPLLFLSLFQLGCRYRSSKEIDVRQIDDLVTAPAENRLQHEEAETLGLF